MYTITIQGPRKQEALLHRKGTSRVSFETDSPRILVRLLQAQGWMMHSWGPKAWNFVGEHMNYTEIAVYKSGLVLAKGDEAALFLSSLVEWSGGAL